MLRLFVPINPRKFSNDKAGAALGGRQHGPPLQSTGPVMPRGVFLFLTMPHLRRVGDVAGGAGGLREAGAGLVQPRVQDVRVQQPRDAAAATQQSQNMSTVHFVRQFRESRTVSPEMRVMRNCSPASDLPCTLHEARPCKSG